METEEQTQGSFKLLRSFLGSIAGGLSSLASLPFGTRQKPESPLLADPGPSSSPGADLSSDDLSRLYPDRELSETRKRARWSLDDVMGFNNSEDGKFLDRKGLEETFEIGIAGTSLGLDSASIPLSEQCNPDNMLDDVVANSGNVSNGANGGIQAQLVANPVIDASISRHDEAPQDVREDLDDSLASFQSSIKPRKEKEQKHLDNLSNEESSRKKVRFGESKVGDSQAIESMPEQKVNVKLKKGSTKTKRKRTDVAENSNRKRLRPLTLSGEPVRPEERTSTVGMSSILTRKRRRANNDNLDTNIAIEVLKPQKDKRLERIEETDELINSQGAHSVPKDEQFSKVAAAHETEEVGNVLHGSGAHAGVSKEMVSADVDETWRVFISNTPTDVKDQELFDLFNASGSLNLEVASVKVMRDPCSGLSKGTAYVFFKTEADVNRLVSSRRSFKLRGRVLRISRAVASERKFEQLRPVKRPANPETKDRTSPHKRVNLSSVNGSETAAKELVQEDAQILTRSRTSGESGREQLKVMVASSHVAATEEKTGQSLPAKRPNIPETKKSNSLQNQVKSSSFCEGATAEEECVQEVQLLTRSRRSNAESGKEHLGVVVASSHVYVTRKVATSPHKDLDNSPKAKGNSVEKHQRGIPRSKKTRRT